MPSARTHHDRSAGLDDMAEVDAFALLSADPAGPIPAPLAEHILNHLLPPGPQELADYAVEVGLAETETDLWRDHPGAGLRIVAVIDGYVGTDLFSAVDFVVFSDPDGQLMLAEAAGERRDGLGEPLLGGLGPSGLVAIHDEAHFREMVAAGPTRLGIGVGSDAAHARLARFHLDAAVSLLWP